MKSTTYYEVYTGDNKLQINNYEETCKTKESALRMAKRFVEEGDSRYSEVVEAKVIYKVQPTGSIVTEYK